LTDCERAAIRADSSSAKVRFGTSIDASADVDASCGIARGGDFNHPDWDFELTSAAILAGSVLATEYD
jgi:hypothetical protein